MACLIWCGPAAIAAAQDRPQVEVPRGDQVLRVTADTIETADEEIVARGAVVAEYGDYRLTADLIRYRAGERRIVVEGNLELVRGRSWLRGSRAELSVDDHTGVIHDAYGFTDEEIFVRVRTLTKTGPTTYLAEDGYLTACQDSLPKWSFRVSRATIDTESTARLKHTVFRVKQVPLFYFPYLVVPSEKRERSSGFLLPTTGTSNNKGRRLTNRYYLVLGRSADLMLQQDYYSRRGLGSAFNLRMRPNPTTSLDLTGELVDDRLNQGGASLEGVGVTRFGSGFRAAADFSLVSNFRFRQTFSDSFFTATRPTEESRFFLTNNTRARSLNILLARDETLFPGRSTVTQATPALQFRLLGQRVPGTRLYVDLDSSVSGMNRSDSRIETPKVSQRIDFYPRGYFSLPLLQGLRVTPSLGIRQTFYSDSIDGESETEPVSGDSVHRQYLDLDISLGGWGLSRIWEDGRGRRWKHLLEPVVRYRRVTGIEDFRRIIRFDALDAIAETNEIEYALVNRLFVKGGPGRQPREWLSWKVSQKYFFDPAFGGAIREGGANHFFPLNTLSGIPYALGPRDLSPVTSVLRLNPGHGASLDLRGDFDTTGGDFRSFSLTGNWQNQLLAVAATYFAAEELVGTLRKTRQLQGRVVVGDQNRGLSGLGVFSYDGQADRFLNHLVRLNYYWDCCGVSLEVGGFNISNRQERQLRFSFFLKGIGSFGNIRRPDAVF
jgi:LPS-assembly protein